jgi:hypothetical protein
MLWLVRDMVEVVTLHLENSSTMLLRREKRKKRKKNFKSKKSCVKKYTKRSW